MNKTLVILLAVLLSLPSFAAKRATLLIGGIVPETIENSISGSSEEGEISIRSNTGGVILLKLTRGSDVQNIYFANKVSFKADPSELPQRVDIEAL